jgi:hypothetical protein
MEIPTFIFKNLEFHIKTNIYLKQWNLSNPTHQGTREMCRIVQDVGILRITEILWDHKFLSDVTGCRIAQVLLYSIMTMF